MAGDPEPQFSHGTNADGTDFAFLVGFFGKGYTWLGNRVVSWNPGGAEGWAPDGPVGVRCFGGAVAGGWLVVALEAVDGGSELWGTDGRGWWRLRRIEPGGVVQVWPTPLGGVGNKDLLVFRDGAGTYDLYRLVPRTGGLVTFSGSAEWRSSLLDAGEPARVKGWAAIGATFGAPEVRGNATSTDAVTIALDYSIDAGATWVQAATLTPAAAGRRFDLTAPLSGVSARALQLRVRWSSLLDWTPVLAGVWADWEVIDAPARRRHWELKVAARDGQVKRDGGTQATTGRQQIAALWAAWQAGQPVTFRDVDYDADPVTRTVTILDIEETTAKPSDAGRWGDAVLSLTLAEA